MGVRRERFRTDNQKLFIGAIESLCTGDESLDLKKKKTKREFVLMSSDVLEKSPCESAFSFMPLKAKKI